MIPLFPLSSPTALPAPEILVPGAPPPAPITLTPAEQPLSQAVLLSVFDRVLDPNYLLPLKQPGPGYEVLQAFASMWLRVSQAAVNSLNVFTLSSQGGAFAQGFVQFSRSVVDMGVETIKAGTLVTTSNGNRIFITLDDAIFTATGTTATDVNPPYSTSIPVQAIVQDYQWNVPGNSVTAAGVVIPGDIDTMVLPLVYCGQASTTVAAGSNNVDIASFQGAGILHVASTAGFTTSGQVTVVTSTGTWTITYTDTNSTSFKGCNSNGAEGVMSTGAAVVFVQQLIYDPAITVTNSAPTTGGRPPILDQIAADQGLTRQQGESDISLAQRIRTLPNTITPQDILTAANDLLAPYLATAQEQEPLGIGALPSPNGYSGILVGFMDVDPLPVNGAVLPEAIGLWYMDQPGMLWQKNFFFAQNNAVHPTQIALTSDGNIFVALNSGYTGPTEPDWPKTLGATVIDNAVTWQLQLLNQPLVGPGLNQVVPVGSTVSLGMLGPSDESDPTSRGFFRLKIPWVTNVDPGLGFAFMGSTGTQSPADLLYPTQGSYTGGNVPLGDYPYAIPGVGFFDNGSYAGDAQIVSKQPFPADPGPPYFELPQSPTSKVAGQIYNNTIQMIAAGVGFEITVGP